MIAITATYTTAKSASSPATVTLPGGRASEQRSRPVLPFSNACSSSAFRTLSSHCSHAAARKTSARLRATPENAPREHAPPPVLSISHGLRAHALAERVTLTHVQFDRKAPVQVAMLLSAGELDAPVAVATEKEALTDRDLALARSARAGGKGN